MTMHVIRCEGYTHYEYDCKTYDQLLAEIYGIKLSAQEARGRMGKIAKLTESKSKMLSGIDKALERDDMKLFEKLNEKWFDLDDELQKLYTP